MKLAVVPVEHLVLEGVMKLGSILFFPVDFILMKEYSKDYALSKDDMEIVNYIIYDKGEILEFFSNLQYCNLAVIRIDELESIEKINHSDFDKICHQVSEALEFFMITGCRFDRKEWTIGRPGVISSFRVIGLIDSENNEKKYVRDNVHIFSEIPGLGLEISYISPKSIDLELYNILFSERDDEIYLKCRALISRACEAFYINDLNSCFSHLFSIVEGMGMIGSDKFLNFTIENKRIMAMICKNQSQYEAGLDEFCYYSETLRTLIIHKGYDLLEITDLQGAFRIITSIFYTIIKFSKRIIQLEIYSEDQVEHKINECVNAYEEHSSNSPKTCDKIPKLDCGGERDIFIVPVDNLLIDEIIAFKDMLILPKELIIEDINEELFRISKISKKNFYKIVNEKNTKEIIGKVAVILYRGTYKLNEFNASEVAVQYLDDICKKIQYSLSPFIINDFEIKNRDEYFSAIGVYDGYRRGILYDTVDDTFYPLLGRVYSLYNNTQNPYKLEEKIVKKNWLYNILLETREDKIYQDCQVSLHKVCDAMYADDLNETVMYLFDAIEALYPLEFNVKYTMKWIIPFVMKSRSDYDRVRIRLNIISQDFRTNIYHYGKTIYEIINDKEEQYKFIDELKEIILDYCEEVLGTGITSYDDLKSERLKRLNSR